MYKHPIVYRRINAAKVFMEVAIKEAEEIEYLYSYKKSMIPLTKEQQDVYDSSSHCYICSGSFTKEDWKVRDHCHLTEKDLLKKCLHGRTQNPNESFNKCIWERIPKTVFVGIETLKFGVMDAVICFNDGYVSRIKVFEALGIKPGYNTERALLIIDNKRIF
ncbi:uncharacterized protein TNCV_2167791 [Trichonephila clavipes]|nr:uncharacterized protein TNCV_2167791 [Trichonephila clavipes]